MRLPLKPIAYLCLFAFSLMAYATTGNELFAQPVAENSELKTRKIFVPKNKEEQWPKGDWVPITKERFEKFIDSKNDTKSKTTPPNLQLKKTQYKLRVDKKNEIQGTFVSEIQSSTEKSGSENKDFEVLPLSKTNLNISSVQSEVQTIKKRNDVSWGTDSSGHNFALVPTNTYRLHGIIHGFGNDFGDILEFNLVFPKSEQTLVSLALPMTWDLEISKGKILSSKTVADKKIRNWKIQLGSSNQLMIQILKSTQASKSKTTIFCSESSSWSIAQNTALFQGEYQFEVLGKPLNQLSWDIPDELAIESVTLGGELPIKFETRLRGTRKILVARLPESLSGKGRSIFVRGNVKPDYDTDWEIPYLTARNVVMLKSVVGIRVNHPLDIQKYETRGYQQTVVNFDPGISQLFRFEKLLPDGKLFFNISQPSSKLFARTLISHQLRGDKWKSTTKILLGARRGQQNIIQLEIPERVNIRKVSAVSWNSTETELNGWRIRRIKGKRNLEIQLLNPVSSSSSKLLTITGVYQKANFTKRKMNFLTKVLNCEDQDIILEFSATNQWSIAPAPGRNAKFVSAYSNETTPVSWGDSDLLNLEFALSNESSIWRISERSNKTILFEVTSQKSDANNTVVMRYFLKESYLFCHSDLLLDSKAIEQKTIQKNEAYKFLVYFSESPKLPSWSLYSNSKRESQLSLITKLIDNSKHIDFELPPHGSLWEISIVNELGSEIVQPLSSIPQEIHIRWAQPLVSEISLPLCFIVDDEFSTGKLRIIHSIDKEIKIEATASITKLDESNEESKNFLYNFQYPSEKISISTVSQTLPVSTIAQPELLIETKIPQDVNRPTEYRMMYQWQNPVAASNIKIAVPSGMKMVAMQVNNQPANVRMSSNYLLLPNTQSNQIDSIELLLTNSQKQNAFSIQNSISLPDLNVQPKSFRWEILNVSGKNIFWEEHSIQSSISENMTQAFLGPWMQLAGRPELNSNFKFESITSPSTISFSVVRSDMIEKTSWILFSSILISLLLIKSISKNSGRLAAIVLAIVAIAFSGFVSSQYLAFCGAISSASLISLFIPIEIIKSTWNLELIRKVKANISIPQWAKKRFKTNGLGLFFLILFFNTAIAQNTSTNQELPFDILVPTQIDGKNPSASKILYVPSGLHKKILEEESDSKSIDGYVVRNAEYQVKIDDENSLKVIAKYDLSIFKNTDKQIDFKLPFSNVTFDGLNSCKVNGQVANMTQLPNQKGVRVELPSISSDKKQEIISEAKLEISFFPEVKKTGDIQFFEVSIPEVSSSYISIEGLEDNGTVSALRSNNEIVPVESTTESLVNPLNPKPIWIGETQTLKVLWSQKTTSAISTTKLKADLFTFVNVQPTLIRVRFRANYTVESGQTRKLSWRLPSKSLVRNVTGEFIKSFSSQSLRNGLTRLDIELESPREEAFQVEAQVDLPIRFLDKTVRIPAFDLFGSAGNSSRLETGQLFIGFSSLDGFETKFEGGRADLFSLITTEKYQEEWGSNPPSVSPGSVYQLASPVEFVAKLTPRIPKINLNAVQVLEIHSTETVLSAVATLKPTEIPIYRYIVQCDPKFILDSISIQQDGVERLSQWRRIGNELQLFLNGPSLSEQEIKIVGRLEIPSEEDSLITPLIFLQANSITRNRFEIVNSTTQVGTQISNIQGMTLSSLQTKVEKTGTNTENELSDNSGFGIGRNARDTVSQNERAYEVDNTKANFELKLFLIPKPSNEKSNSNNEKDLEIPEEYLYENAYFKAPLILHRIMKRSKKSVAGETSIWIREIDAKFLYWNHIPGMTLLNTTVNGESLDEIYQSDTKWVLPIRPIEDVCSITVNWKLDVENANQSVSLPEPNLNDNSIRFVMLNSMSDAVQLMTSDSKSVENQDRSLLANTIFEMISSSFENRELSFSTNIDWAKLVEMQLNQVELLASDGKAKETALNNGRTLLDQIQKSSPEFITDFATSKNSNWVMTDSPEILFKNTENSYGSNLAWLQLFGSLAFAFILYHLGFAKLDDTIRDHPRGAILITGIAMIFLLPGSYMGYTLILAAIVWKISLTLRGVQPMMPEPE